MSGSKVPLIRNADEIDIEWIRRALAAGGMSAASEIAAVEVEELSDVTSALGKLYRCRMMVKDGEAADPASVIVKLPGASSMALRVASKWMSIYRREYVFYRDIAPHGYVRAPTLYYGDFDERSHHVVLVLEDLGDMEAIPQSVDIGAARARSAVREIAGLHGCFWEADDEPALAACQDFLNAGQRRIMQTLYLLTLPVALERFGDLFTPQTRRLAEEFGFRIAAHFGAISAGPKTVMHGDFRTDNMLFGGEGRNEPAVIDWQTFGIGCGMYDIAFLLGTSVSIDVRRRIERDVLEEYHDIVLGSGAGRYTVEDAWRSYRQNMLGALVTMVIGCGALDIREPELVSQSRELLSRVLTAIEDLGSWEFQPPRERLLGAGWGFATLSRGGHRAYRLALRMRPRRNRNR